MRRNPRLRASRFKRRWQSIADGRGCALAAPPAENFLLTNTTDEAELKAADFGLARWFKQGEARAGALAWTTPSA